ncbi:hypothetical protein BH11MYX2_BH11MYX2_19450 [soil metagenome]
MSPTTQGTKLTGVEPRGTAPCVAGSRFGAEPTPRTSARGRAGLLALLSSNPNSPTRASTASALLLFENWCIVLGDYHLYVRSIGQAFERIEPPIGRRDPVVLQLAETTPELSYIARDTHVRVEHGLAFHEPGDCVYDLAGYECLASTAPLHDHPQWAQIARAPLDSVESSGASWSPCATTRSCTIPTISPSEVVAHHALRALPSSTTPNLMASCGSSGGRSSDGPMHSVLDAPSVAARTAPSRSITTACRGITQRSCGSMDATWSATPTRRTASWSTGR